MAEGGSRDETERNRGFNKHWFTKREKASEYKCGTCQQILNNPQQIVVCGHRFCQHCLPAAVKKCPECGEEVKENQVFPDEAVKNKVLSLQMKCPRKSCKWKGSLSDFQKNHEKTCPCELVKCTNQDCHERHPREALARHMEECEKRLIKCEYCAKNITVTGEKTHHDKDCERIPTPCPQECERLIPKQEIKKHVDDDCEKTQVDCLFKNVNCALKVERGKVKKHERDETQQHLHLILLALNNITAEKQEMVGQIKELQNLNEALKEELKKSTEAQEQRTTQLQEHIKEIEEQGTRRLDTVQMAIEQNFESVEQLNEENRILQENSLLLETKLEELRRTSIASLEAACCSQEVSINKLIEEQNKSRKMSVSIFQHFTKALAEQKDATHTTLDKLTQRHEEHWDSVKEFQAKTRAELLRLDDAVKEAEARLRAQKTALGAQKTALLVVKDDVRDQFRNVSTQMERDYENLAGMISKEVRSRSEGLRELSEDVRELGMSSDTGCYLWRIKDVEASLEMAKVDPKSAIIGQAFSSHPNGYLLRSKLFLNGARQEDRSNVSLFLQIMKSPNDGALAWPFGQRVRFTLVDQQESPQTRRDVSRDVLPSGGHEEWNRPSDKANNGYGIYKFVEHKTLHKRNYIVEDTMFIRVEVFANDDHHAHSETI